MKYFMTTDGIIYNEDLKPIILDDNNEEYKQYLLFLKSNGTVEQLNQNALDNSIEDEFLKYKNRKAEGENLYLKISAILRVNKLKGIISEDEHQSIENELSSIRQELVLGQWITAQYKMSSLNINIIGQDLYVDIQNRIEYYIKYNYE